MNATSGCNEIVIPQILLFRFVFPFRFQNLNARSYFPLDFVEIRNVSSFKRIKPKDVENIAN